jgi:hypothetical protein
MVKDIINKKCLFTMGRAKRCFLIKFMTLELDKNSKLC